MKLRALLEMTQSQALQIFAKHGEELSGASADDVKKARNRLVRQFQSDLVRGGESDLKLINAAFDVLKGGVSSGGSSSRSGSRWDAEDREWGGSRASRQQPQGTPPWAWAGHSGGMAPSGNISQENFRDVNFIKKTMWELSGQSKEEWTIWGFDGRFFRNTVTVYGNEKIFAKMAEAMYVWQTQGGNSYPCRAVLVTNKSLGKEIWLIYADDQMYASQPIELRHHSNNSNPGNDRTFTEYLTRLIDDLQGND